MSRRRPNPVPPSTPPEPLFGALGTGGSTTRAVTASTPADNAREAPAVDGTSQIGSEAATSSLEVTVATATDTNVRAPSRSRRIPGVELAVAAETSEPGASACWHADACGEPTVAADQTAAVLTVLMLVERFKRVFLSGEEGPVATADGGVRQTATIELVLAVRDAVNDLWTAHEAEIKRRCKPFMPQGLIAKQEVFGFALADALGRPILPGDKAMKVGQNGDNAVRSAEGSKDRKGKLTAAREAARAAVRKAQREAAKDAALEQGVADAEEAGAQAIRAVLDRRVDLDLPNETVGAKRKRAVAAAAAPAEPTLAALRQAVRAAQEAVRAAAEAHSVSASRLSRAQRQLDVLGPQPCWSAWKLEMEIESIDGIEAEEEEQWQKEYAAMEAAIEARYAAAIALFERAEARVHEAQTEEIESQRVLHDAEYDLGDAELDVEWAVHDAQHREHREQWEREEAERTEREDKARAENAELRARLANYEDAQARQEAETMHDPLDIEHERTCAEFDDVMRQWDAEDAEQAARAEDEMSRTSGAVGARRVSF